METVSVTENYPKECYELGKGVGDFILAVKTALADGWQLGEDLPVIMGSAMATLVPSVAGVENMPAEMKEDAIGVGQSLISGLKPAIKELTGFQKPVS